MPLVTQAELEQFGQVDFTNEPDTAVGLYIAAAQKAVENHCGRLFERQAGRVDTLDGSAGRHLWLPLYPIHTITSVTEDTTALTEGSDFLTYSSLGRLTRMSGDWEWSWTAKRQSVVVTYTAGYEDGQEEDIPADLKWVVANVCLRLFKAEEAWANSPAGAAGPLQSVTLDGVGSRTFGAAPAATSTVTAQGGQQSAGSSPSLTPAEKAALAPYRRLHLGGSVRPQDLF